MSSQPVEDTSAQIITQAGPHGEVPSQKIPFVPDTPRPIEDVPQLTWYSALKHIFSTYVAVHLAFCVTTVFSVLFIMQDFSNTTFPLHTLWTVWQRKDATQFRNIALLGYADWWRTAFFPLFPLLERGLRPLIDSPYIGGMVIADTAGLGMLVVLYRLVYEDFDKERALRTILYLSVFPTAFFFAAAYSESLFLCLSLLSFYAMRRSNWWLAGIFGCLASLTRSAGILLLVPFAYEYLYQHQFNLRKMRVDVLSGGLIALGTGLFAAYCYYKFHDALEFSHAQSMWGRAFAFPGVAYFTACKYVVSTRPLSFVALRNILDIVQDFFVLLLVILGFVGPWRMPRRLLSYSLYALVLYAFFQMFPISNPYPLTSIPRYLLSIFPAFIVLAGIGKYRGFHLNYLLISCSLLFFTLLQFLSGHWVT